MQSARTGSTSDIRSKQPVQNWLKCNHSESGRNPSNGPQKGECHRPICRSFAASFCCFRLFVAIPNHRPTSAARQRTCREQTRRRRSPPGRRSIPVNGSPLQPRRHRNLSLPDGARILSSGLQGQQDESRITLGADVRYRSKAPSSSWSLWRSNAFSQTSAGRPLARRRARGPLLQGSVALCAR